MKSRFRFTTVEEAGRLGLAGLTGGESSVALLRARWAEIVGDYLARRTEPVSLSRGVLAIRLREDEARRVVKGLLPEMSKKASAACPPVRSVVLVQK
jgi:hypothetical protein